MKALVSAETPVVVVFTIKHVPTSIQYLLFFTLQGKEQSSVVTR